jgi:hypothetical protein
MPSPTTDEISVLPDGSWHIGAAPIVHQPSLAYLKAHLVFTDHGAFLEERGKRLKVTVAGPAFQVVRLVLDESRGTARVVLDDASEEPLTDLAMGHETARFECAARGGCARAAFSRGAHQTLLEHAVEEDGRFFLRSGEALIPIRT